MISGHYPFGARENHPYKVWCKAVRETLDLMFGKDHKPQVHSQWFCRFAGDPAIDPRIMVYGYICEWCLGSSTKPCMICDAVRDPFNTLFRESLAIDMEINSCLSEKRYDDARRGMLVFSDWWEERGYQELAEAIREQAGKDWK